jgi:HYR domain
MRRIRGRRVTKTASTSVHVPISWTVSDVGAGPDTTSIFVSDNGVPYVAFVSDVSATSTAFTGQVGHIYDFYAIVRDRVGNIEGPKTASEARVAIVGDSVAPVTTATTTPAANLVGWLNAAATVTLTAVDANGGTGVKAIRYRVSGAQAQADTTVDGQVVVVPIVVDGVTTVTFFAVDRAGNVEVAKENVARLDRVAPSILVPNDMTVRATSPAGAIVTYPSPTVTDAISGVSSSTCLPGSGTIFPIGTSRVTCSATDQAGNTRAAEFVVNVQAGGDAIREDGGTRIY